MFRQFLGACYSGFAALDAAMPFALDNRSRLGFASGLFNADFWITRRRGIHGRGFV